MDLWFREIYVPRAWRVDLATGFDFREKYRAGFGPIGARPQNFVYVLRTITTRHMVSFIDFYFHFLTNIQI